MGCRQSVATASRITFNGAKLGRRRRRRANADVVQTDCNVVVTAAGRVMLTLH